MFAMESACDVAIIGGGPAGCAAALSLRAHAPGLAVTLIEASTYERVRVGETLPAAAARVLQHLGLLGAFRAQNHSETFGSAAAWGHNALQDNDFVFSARGHGWHLNRRAFDAMLAEQVAARGAQTLLDTRVIDARRTRDAQWNLRLSTGGKLRARFVIDASGPSAVFARSRGADAARSDRLSAHVRLFDDTANSNRRTLVEAFADGWWYTAPIPGGRRVAACMTDHDIATRIALHTVEGWGNALRAAPHVRESIGDSSARGPLLVRGVASRILKPAAGRGWLAAGDAAAIFDPLSSQGILKALRSGVFASYAVADVLLREAGDALERYDEFVTTEFTAYARVRDRYYAQEQRWPDSDFWLRRNQAYAHV